MFFKLVICITTTIAAMFIAGVCGLYFYIWPTNVNDHKLSVTPAVIQGLRSLQSERKFGPDIAAFYPGAMNEVQRLEAQAVVDVTIQILIDELPAHPQRSTVLGAMKIALARFSGSESEERDQILVYFGKVMRICGVQSSGELFNVWRYGLPYGWFR